MVNREKGTDTIRMCFDLSHLNKYVKWERYQCLTPAQAVAHIASNNAKVFTKLDAFNGYYQCPLDEGSQILTTLIISHATHVRQILQRCTDCEITLKSDPFSGFQLSLEEYSIDKTITEAILNFPLLLTSKSALK